jgi:hypothetical protein
MPHRLPIESAAHNDSNERCGSGIHGRL